MKVSILIPTHNRSELLAKALQSITLLNKLSEFQPEVIILANACSDNTVEMSQSLAEDFPVKLTVIEEEKPGLSHARNLCMQHAKGDILAFIDDDVYLSPNWLEALLKTYQSSNADIVGGKVKLWWEELERPIWMSQFTEALLSHKDNGNEVKELKHAYEIVGANFSFHKRILEKVAPFNTSLGRNASSLLAGEEKRLHLTSFGSWLFNVLLSSQ